MYRSRNVVTRSTSTSRGPADEIPRIALFVDGPNMLRKEFMIDLRELKKSVLKYGRVTSAKVFVNQFAPEKLIEAIINEGFQAEMILAEVEAEKNDIDVAMAIGAVEAAIARDIDFVALATRDADYMPVIHMAKAYGKRVIVIGAEPGMSSGLQNAADYVEML
ncbi:MAG: NYN domain-containing protein [Candidatus Aenigmarchaeota archaeon]|nr:NYN domain-containing protein [Candidatus Aenigmarchaeota archaeon]